MTTVLLKNIKFVSPPLPLLAEKSKKKAITEGPQFTSGVIMKITDNKTLPGRKFIKVQ